MVIAIDGPAGAGKSTIAKKIAEQLQITFLNSGSFYRAITLAALRNKIDFSDEVAIVNFAEKLNLSYKNSHLILNNEDVENLLHTEEISMQTSKISCIIPIRHIVNKKIREITQSQSIVCEGRDMTTVVFPDADCKYYLDASLETQVLRRYKQYKSENKPADFEEIKRSIQERDAIDKNKPEGKLKIASDALYIDTTHLTIEQICATIVDKIYNKGFIMAEKEVLVDESQNSAESVQTQLQERYLKNLESLEEGQLVDGIVVQVTSDQVFVDVGYKSEGKIPLTEFQVKPEIGDTVSVVLITKENKYGEVIVSKQKADVKSFWKNLRQAIQDKTPIEGTVEKQIKGGYDVNLGSGVHAFLPISQADVQKADKPEKLIGLKSNFLIERLYSDNKANIVVNRRKYLEDSMNASRNAFFENTNIGDIVKGEVKSFTSFGAFIDLGGFDGLLHINDMSWGHVTRPKDFVKKGQEIELKVIRLDPEEKRINLSLKHFLEDPWLQFENKFHVNEIVKGRVTKLTEFGAFIELEEGIEGLAHISEFSWVKKIHKPQDVVKIGDGVECMILGYDIQAGRVSLGLKQVTENPWDTIGEKYPLGMHVTKPVVKITNAGAFIQLEEGIDAFLHNDDFSWTKKIKSLNSELKVDEEIEAVVIENDPENHRLRVGVKQLSEDPWLQFASAYHPGSTLEGEITALTDFGVFVRVSGGIEGLINKANLSDNREEAYEDAVKKYTVGDKITVFVVDVNPERQKVAFSVKELKKKQQREEISQYMSSNQDGDDGTYTLGDMIKNRR